MSDEAYSDNSDDSATGAGGTTKPKPSTAKTVSQRHRGQRGEQMFVQSVHDTLEQTGALAALRASMRATIMSVIRNGDCSSINRVSSVYRTPAIDLVHALIADYLQWIGFHYTAEMFATESGSPPAAASATGSGGDGGDGGGGGTAGNARQRMDLAGRVAGGTADGGCRLAESVIDVPVLLAMVVQGMRLDDDEDDEVKDIGTRVVG